MQHVHWGIIGCGDVTEKKSGPGFAKANGSDLVAVMRRDAAKAKDYAARHNVPRWYSKAEDLLQDPDVNAVYIATPPAYHLSYTIMAAEAGKPIYVEKPMAINVKECEKMLEACCKNGVPLYVAYYRRALPRFLKVKQLIDAGALGETHSFAITLHKPPSETDRGPHTQWRVDPSISGGGYFIDLASHTLDLIDYLFGPITEVNGFAVNRAGLYAAEDNVAAVFKTKSHIVGSGTWSFSTLNEEDEVRIIGTRGSLSFTSFTDKPVILNTDTQREEFSIEDPPHVQQPLIQTVVDELVGHGTCPSTGKSALRTTRVTDEILKGYYQSLY
ncbi:MAG: Gfo/Idh/MocA family oxidoreductase [Spirochaetia bacterium]